MQSTDEIRTQIMKILTDHDLLDRDGQLVTPDSMAMVLISMQIENHWVPFPQEYLEVDHFVSIDSIVNLVETLIRQSDQR